LSLVSPYFLTPQQLLAYNIRSTQKQITHIKKGLQPTEIESKRGISFTGSFPNDEIWNTTHIDLYFSLIANSCNLHEVSSIRIHSYLLTSFLETLLGGTVEPQVYMYELKYAFFYNHFKSAAYACPIFDTKGCIKVSYRPLSDTERTGYMFDIDTYTFVGFNRVSNEYTWLYKLVKHETLPENFEIPNIQTLINHTDTELLEPQVLHVDGHKWVCAYYFDINLTNFIPIRYYNNES
jgi:hypothetical protein